MAHPNETVGYNGIFDVQFHYETDAQNNPEEAVRQAAKQLQEDLGNLNLPFVSTSIFQATTHNDDGEAPTYLVILDVELVLRYPGAETSESAEQDAYSTIELALNNQESLNAIHFETIGTDSETAPNIIHEN